MKDERNTLNRKLELDKCDCTIAQLQRSWQGRSFVRAVALVRVCTRDTNCMHTRMCNRTSPGMGCISPYSESIALEVLEQNYTFEK